MTDPLPVRLQLSRRKGSDLQALSRATNGLDVVKVDRATGFGNPFPIHKGTSPNLGVTTDIWTVGTWSGPAFWICDSQAKARQRSIAAFEAWIALPAQSGLRDRARLALRGRNLACWCAPPAAGEPDMCHARIWIALVNSPTCEAR